MADDKIGSLLLADVLVRLAGGALNVRKEFLARKSSSGLFLDKLSDAMGEAIEPPGLVGRVRELAAVGYNRIIRR